MNYFLLAVVLISLVSCANDKISELETIPEIPKDSVSKYGFFNRVEYGADHVICIKNEALRSCLDIEYSSCSELVEKYVPECKSKLEPMVPNFLSRSMADRLSRDFADCLSYGVIKSQSKSILEVENCVKKFRQ